MKPCPHTSPVEAPKTRSGADLLSQQFQGPISRFQFLGPVLPVLLRLFSFVGHHFGCRGRSRRGARQTPRFRALIELLFLLSHNTPSRATNATLLEPKNHVSPSLLFDTV